MVSSRSDAANTERGTVARARSQGGKLNRSETVTVRLDPKLNYLCELAARAQRRTKSSFIEWAVQEALRQVSIPEVSDWNEEPVHIADWAKDLWQVDEPDRVMMLALKAPALLTYEEQHNWRLVRECGAFWLGNFGGPGDTWRWQLEPESLQLEMVRNHWPTIKALAEGEPTSEKLPTWRRKKQEVTAFDDLDDDTDVPF
jgi:hypothetical protein